MKRYKLLAVGVILSLLIAAMCVYPVSADILSDYTTSYNESTQKVHVKVTLTGGEEGARASEYPRDFVIVMDVSLSMKDMYKGKTRLEWAKNATMDFLESLYAYKSRVGVITFSDAVTEVCPLTFNFEDVKRSIEGNVSSHGFSTNYGDGIQKAALVLKGREREALPIIILLTDGGEDKGATSVEDAVDFAMKEGIVIYVVSFGDSEWIDEVMLREKVAEQTGGEYRHTSFERLGDALIGVQKMEEFLSAANPRIRISQSDDAVLDFYSIPSRPLATSGVIVTAKDSSSFVSPKLSRGEKIIIEFDAFTAKEGESVTIGVVDVYYTSKEGGEEKVPVSVEYNIPPSPPWFALFTITFVILSGILLMLLITIKRWRKEKGMAEGKSKESENYKSMLNDNKTIIEEAIKKLKEAKEFMRYETGEREEIIKRLEEATKKLEEVKSIR